MRSLLFLLFTVFVVESVRAQLITDTLYAVADTYISADLLTSTTYSGHNTTHGSDTLLRVSKQDLTSPTRTEVRRSLMKFDLSGIPAGAVIESASLRMSKVPGSSNYNTYRAAMITKPWTESGVIWDSISTSTNSLFVGGVQSASTSFASFNLLSMTTQWQCRYPNFGVMVHINNEGTTASATPCDFHSSEGSNPDKRPFLIVKYYPAIQVEAVLTPAETLISTDGAVDISVSGGYGSSYSYTWYDNTFSSISTSQDLSSKTAGIYWLIVTDSHGGSFRSAFIIPCQTENLELTITPNATFGEDTHYTQNSTAATDPSSYNLLNSGWYNGFVGFYTKFESILDFNIDLASLAGFEVEEASMTLTLSGTNTAGSNAVKLNRVITPWNEDCACWHKKPSYVTTNQMASASRTGNVAVAFDLTWYYREAVISPDEFNGFVFVPDNSYSGSQASYQNFWSSQWTTTSYRPKLELTIRKGQVVSPVHAQIPQWINATPSTLWVNQADNVLRKTSGGSASPSFAYSSQTLGSSTDGWVEYTNRAGISHSRNRGAGLVTSTSVDALSDINYGFVLDSTQSRLKLYHLGSLLNTISVVIGDVFRIERIGSTVYYKVNGVIKNQVNQGGETLRVVGYLDQNFGNLEGVECSFAPSYDSDWSDQENFTFDSMDNVLTKDSDTLSAAALTYNVISPVEGGFIEYTYDTLSSYLDYWSFGLDSSRTLLSEDETDYAFTLNGPDGEVSVFTSDSLRDSRSLSHGDVLRLEMLGSRMRWSVNGTLWVEDYPVSDIPHVIHIYSPDSAVGEVPMDKFSLSFSSRPVLAVSATDLDTLGVATVKLRPYGIPEGRARYLWSDTYFTEESWEDSLATLDTESLSDFEGIDFRNDVLTHTNQFEFTGPIDGKVWIVDTLTGEYSDAQFLISEPLRMLSVSDGIVDTLRRIVRSTGDEFELSLEQYLVPGYTNGLISFSFIGSSWPQAQIGFGNAMGGSGIQFGFDFSGRNGFSVLHGEDTFNFGTPSMGSVYSIRVDSLQIEYLENDFVLRTESLVGGIELGLEVILKDKGTITVLKKVFGHDKYNKSGVPVVTHATCDDLNGHVSFSIYNRCPGVLFPPFVIRDRITNELVMQNESPISAYQNIELPPGSYKLTIGNLCGKPHNFDIGYYVDWDLLTTGINELLSPKGSLEDVDPIQVDQAESRNRSDFVQSGWVEWEFDRTRLGRSISGAIRDREATFLSSIAVYKPMHAVISRTNSDVCESEITPIYSVFGLSGVPNGNLKRFKISWDSDVIKIYLNNTLRYCNSSSNFLNSEGGLRMFAILHASIGAGNQHRGLLIRARTSFQCYNFFSPYAKLKREMDGGVFFVHNGVLRFEYDEEYLDEDGDLKFKVFDLPNLTGIPIIDSSDESLSSEYGDNRLSIDVGELSKDYYLLEVSNDKDEKWYLKFFIY